MKNLIVRFAISLLLLLCFSMTITAQKQGGEEQTAQQEIQNEKPDVVNRKTTNGKSQAEKPLNAGQKAVNDSAVDNNLADSMLESTITSTPDTDIEPIESAGFHQALKTKFIEGNAGFMSLVALALVIGLAFCIERIIYLSLSEINAKQFMRDLEAKINTGDIEAAKDLCRDTRGPVASICYQGLVRIDESIDNIERSVAAYGSVQAANLEKGCSWITLFIAMAPSLGFLGTVIGMVMAFDQIQSAGDISPTIVASGMKVALITTIFGIIVALILQIFYNYILSKIEHLTSQMEESAITLLDSVMKYQLKK
ncbi:MotA/TolQ/ExbB proton channel family protein [Hoylesella pleuritidis]|uniref:Transporter, MotA/TolQ/ExbB proton channel family protein n=1 Tax=Hoylesella pleuritidis F0068 TaxID=1081904 RepID=U2LGR6_9BACT|nr:MotA/TolQ/ExbB proton channel family protein [Hoylesella pleuritidis]ERK03658.1 transporter, MotA/TolQ/ExbB proton channel family protein [Hoylesella pleuritidis F0068]